MKERKPCIYKITNLIDGKVYIGQTCRSLSERKKCHLSELRRGVHENTHLLNSFKKYKEHNFVFEVLQECEIDKIDELEIFWINLFNSTNRKFGYNLETGGCQNKSLSEETKNKISKSIKKIVEMGGNKQASKKVICINDNKIFNSGVEASNYYKIPYNNLNQVLINRNNCCLNANGEYLQFRHYEEGKKYSLKEINEKSIKLPKSVICLNTRQIFESTQNASKVTGVSQSKISMVCNGKRLSAGKDESGNKLLWKFLDDFDENEMIYLEEINDKADFRKAKKVKCLNTGEIFDSVRKAGVAFNIKPPTTVSLACRGLKEYAGKLPNGEKIKWEFFNEHP